MQPHSTIVVLLALTLCCCCCCGSVGTAFPADEFERSLDFLRTYMTPRDQISFLPQFVNETASLALTARYSSSWAASVPFDVFLENVLPFCVVNEPRDNWRPLFFKTLLPLVESATSITDAFRLVNGAVWTMWGIAFQSESTPEVMAPFETMAYHYASCTGQAILLVDALRAVGVPARMTGTMCWNTPQCDTHPRTLTTRKGRKPRLG
eukprot:TRINITY_DN1771_c0_g1_i3.p1 TRINITY_DN1771_c0_g1~~TRINITY_DN1771_c0_g1_i3.p1  ORF type:complete len:232 (-),score=36.22 TRINITY_DN1771_c0_g1_i3:271-894(-)